MTIQKKEEIERLEKVLTKCEKELGDIKEKMGYRRDSWLFISQNCIDGLKYLLQNPPTCTIFDINDWDKQFVDLINVNQWDLTYAVYDQFKDRFDGLWQKYKDRYNKENGFGDDHVPYIGDVLGYFGEKDEEWVKKRNEDLRYEAYVKYDHSKEVIQDIKTRLGELLELSECHAVLYEKIDKIKNEIDEIKKRGLKEFSYRFYTSWETGITFLVIPYKKNNEKPLDSDTFKRLRNEAGLFNHDYIDADSEERFKGWATNRVEDAATILHEERYFIETS